MNIKFRHQIPKQQEAERKQDWCVINSEINEQKDKRQSQRCYAVNKLPFLLSI